MKKTCTVCLIPKELNDENFHRDSTRKDGFKSRCKPCIKGITAEYRKKKLKEISDSKIAKPGMKFCTECGKEQNIQTEFNIDHSKKDGHLSRCKTCLSKIRNNNRIRIESIKAQMAQTSAPVVEEKEEEIPLLLRNSEKFCTVCGNLKDVDHTGICKECKTKEVNKRFYLYPKCYALIDVEGNPLFSECKKALNKLGNGHVFDIICIYNRIYGKYEISIVHKSNTRRHNELAWEITSSLERTCNSIKSQLEAIKDYNPDTWEN